MSIPKNFGTINAMANITDQTTQQRTIFKSHFNNFGAYTQTNIWEDLNQNNAINSVAFNKMIDLHVKGNYTGSVEYLNPDFTSPIELGHDNTPKISDIGTSTNSLSDKPNILGPNLKSHSFDENGQPRFADNIESQYSLLQMKNKLGKGGFGNYFDNNRLDGATFGSYLRRSASEHYVAGIDDKDRPVLGEYKEIDDIDY